MDATEIITSLISGLVGGNIAGAAMPEDKNLGAVGNSVTGVIGGGIGGYVMHLLGLVGATAATAAANTVTATNALGGMDINTFLANVGGSGVGGAILMIIVGLIKNALAANKK